MLVGAGARGGVAPPHLVAQVGLGHQYKRGGAGARVAAQRSQVSVDETTRLPTELAAGGICTNNLL